MLRYQVFLSIGIAFLSVWYSALQWSRAPWIVYAPVLAIVALGGYALSCITIGLINFKNCPEAALEIERQVEEAKASMVKRGVIK